MITGITGIISDLSLYRRLIGMQLRTQVQYKVNLAVDIFTYFLVTMLEYMVIFLYFNTFQTLLGWHVGEVALLGAVVSFTFGLAELFGSGLDSFSEIIRRGEFDRILLRPVGALMQVASNEFRMRRLGRMTQGLLMFLFALHLLPALHWTFAKLLMLVFGIASGATIFVAVLLLGATLCFWTVETTELANILTYGGREVMSWPLSVYNRAFQSIFLFVVPLAFGLYMPVCYLLGRPQPLGLPDAAAFLSPLAAALFAAVAYVFWRFGVRRYQSAGG
jgi:ABC-2 type transport system permease protein